jgi:hypothetical protein
MSQAPAPGLPIRPDGDDALGGVELPVRAGAPMEILAFPNDAGLALAFWRQCAPTDKDIDDVGLRSARASDTTPALG